jgi:hypothetical protein
MPKANNRLCPALADRGDLIGYKPFMTEYDVCRSAWWRKAALSAS